MRCDECSGFGSVSRYHPPPSPPPSQLNMALMIQYNSQLLYPALCAVHTHTAAYLSVVYEKFGVSQNLIQQHVEWAS